MNRTHSSRTFTLTVDVNGLTEGAMANLEGQLGLIRQAATTIETLLAHRDQGKASLTISDEKHAIETADLEPF